jgi:CHAT domain-containing protein/tetratricopeptide (TPR) repeat protein
MKADLTDRSVLRRFLLGELTHDDETRDAVEERLMTDDAYFEEYELVKEELIDEYAEGEMTSNERKKFEKHFLTSAGRHRDLRVAQAFIPESPSLSEKQLDKTSPGWSLTAWFSPPTLRAAATALAVIAVAFIVWLAFVRSSTNVSQGLQALNDAYRQERPIEARVSGFQHAPWANTRGGDEVKFDHNARSRAEVLLHSAAEKSPGSASEHALGKLLLFEGQSDDAIRHLEEALKTDGNNPRIHSDLGAAWLERGQRELQKGDEAASSESFGKSLDHLQRALEFDPALLDALFNRALVREQLKLFHLAQDDWKTYLQKDSTSPWADEARQKLKALQQRSNSSTQKADELFQSFLAANQNGDDQTSWKLLTQTRDHRGSSIENRLLDEYLAAATSKLGDEARQKLQALTYAGDVGVRVAGDNFTSDLVRFYTALPRERQATLIDARRLLKSAHEQLGKDRTDEALNTYAAARKIFEENGDTAEALLSKYTSAHAHLLQSESNESLSDFEDVRREAEAKGYRWFLGQSLNGLANVHIGLNDFSLAVELSQQSLKILEEFGDVVGVVKVNDQIGSEYMWLGNPMEGLRFHHQAITLATTNSLGPGPLWRTYFLAALTFHAHGLSTAAIDLTQESLRYAETSNTQISISRSYAQMGVMYGSRGNYPEAIASLQRAAESAKRVETEKVRINALGYAALHLGNLYKLQGEYSRAAGSYDEAIRLFDQLNFSAFSYVAHKGKFLACVAQNGACPSVEQELATALSLYEGQRSKILEQKNRYSFFDTEQGVYDVAIDYEFTTKNDKIKAFDYSERCRARSILDPPPANSQQAHHPAATSPPAEPNGLEDIKRAMSDKAQIVQYAVLADKLLIWFVDNNRFEGFQQPISSKSFEEKVVNYLHLIDSRSEKDDGARQRAAAELFDLLIKPVAHLLDRSKLLCIVPDKILNRLPYATLFSASEGRYLIEDYVLTFSPSSTVFVRQTRTAIDRGVSRSERVLSVGDPLFDQEAFPNYRRLPEAEIEAEAIRKMYEPAEILTGRDATKDRVVRAMKQADVIHLATHAVVDPLSPMYSKLLLAKTSGAGDDGVLLTSDIYQLDLRARLVVLPACRTGMERYYGGEGMVGIWSPFVTRNVPLVIASLWAVDSDSTKELMINFHKLRRSGLSSATALQQAQIQMLHDAEKLYQNPYYWAPFIAIGGETRF